LKRNESLTLGSPSARSGHGFIMLCAFLIWILGVVNLLFAQPKRLEQTRPGDCTACHGEQKVLPPNHVDTRTMQDSGCTECHQRNARPLRGILPLGHKHMLNEITCRDCHEKGTSYKALTPGQCLSCHGSYEEVARQTARSDPNPHNSPHYGKEQDCDLCHRQHARSENFCAQCHEWKLTVP
jgi:DnaJ-class molecular chaperone